jgi:hypothetical protein
MENLHLKNLNNLPTGYIILKKLYNLKQNNIETIPDELITEIKNYIKSLNYKNENIANFVRTFLSLLNITSYQQIYDRLDVTIRIITLIYKYKLNEFDINSKIDFEKINNQIMNINEIVQINLTDSKDKNQNIIGIYYRYFEYQRTNTVIFTIKGIDNTITDINNTYC